MGICFGTCSELARVGVLSMARLPCSRKSLKGRVIEVGNEMIVHHILFLVPLRIVSIFVCAMCSSSCVKEV